MSTNTKAWLWTLAVFAVLASLAATLDALGLLATDNPNEIAAKEFRARQDRIERQCNAPAAYVMSQKFVKDRLKSPSSADFPSSPESAVKTAHCSFRIVSWVDAQNAFGATLRTRYQADMRFDGETERWTAQSIRLDE